jgi:hypothetical protein
MSYWVRTPVTRPPDPWESSLVEKPEQAAIERGCQRKRDPIFMSIVMKEAFQNQRNKKGNRISAIPLLFLVA